MPLNRQQRRVLRGAIYTLVFISFAISTFFFVRMLYRNHKADLKARHARLHTDMTEADICKEFGDPVHSFDADYVSERELGRPLPKCGLQIKQWCLGREQSFCVYISRDGELLKISRPGNYDQRTWIERRIDEVLE